MDLRFGDCLDLMNDLSENSVDLLFADLPYSQTACKWDCLIDLKEFWRLANRVCKADAPMIFTTTAKFGNLLINSNPKNFRYDMVWVKSAPVGFLNAKKMPLRKHELIYVFYNKIPNIYPENIARHHKHKFMNSKNGMKGQDDLLYGSSVKQVQNKKYTPPLPTTIIKEDKDDVCGGTGVYCEADHASSKNYVGYGKDNDFTIYEPPLPNTIIKEQENSNKNSVIYGKLQDNGYYKQRKKGEGTAYEPPLPNTILEMKSERGKHSTQKPVSLMEWILKYYSREGGIVLDPTMGSGSMGQACKNMERFFIGFEKDEKIFSIAMERLIDD